MPPSLRLFYQTNKVVLVDNALARVLSGQFSRIGLKGAELAVVVPSTKNKETHSLATTDHASCIPILVEVISQNADWNDIAAIGHRIVHGGARFTEPERITPGLLTELAALAPYAPEHLRARNRAAACIRGSRTSPTSNCMFRHCISPDNAAHHPDAASP